MVENLKYACLFGGGAIRGAAHVGVIKALKEVGVVPTIYAGSSVGSIVAALYAIGYSCDELKDIFLNVNFELFRDLSFGFKTKFALSKGEVFLDWIREKVESKFYGKDYIKGECKPVTFSDIGKNLVIITTNMKDFSCCEFSNYKTPDFEIAMAVRISCCMPGLMRAVTANEKLLVDGDLMKGMPMWKLSESLKNSADRILEIRLEGSFTGDDNNPIEYVNGMYSCMTYSETKFVKSIYKDNDRYDYLVIDTGNVVVVDFNYPTDKRQEIIDSGYKQTMDFFKNDLKNKKMDLADYYAEIKDKLKSVETSLLRKKFEKAKSTLAELFIFLSQINRYIDRDVFNSILMYQKLLYTNIKFGLLGYVKCDNYNSLKSGIRGIIDDLASREKDLKTYISQISV